MGLSKDRLAAGGNHVTTHDIAPGLPVDLSGRLGDIADGTFDVVTAFDVLEHVDDDEAFLAELVRIARTAVVITTPNVWVSKCVNRFHVREYSPPVLLDYAARLAEIRSIEVFASAVPSGDHPTPLPPELFLRTTLPVLGLILWTTTADASVTPPAEPRCQATFADEHDVLVPLLVGSES